MGDDRFWPVSDGRLPIRSGRSFSEKRTLIGEHQLVSSRLFDQIGILRQSPWF